MSSPILRLILALGLIPILVLLLAAVVFAAAPLLRARFAAGPAGELPALVACLDLS